MLDQPATLALVTLLEPPELLLGTGMIGMPTSAGLDVARSVAPTGLVLPPTVGRNPCDETGYGAKKVPHDAGWAREETPPP